MPRDHAGWAADAAVDNQEGCLSVSGEASGQAFSKEKKQSMEQKRPRVEREQVPGDPFL